MAPKSTTDDTTGATAQAEAPRAPFVMPIIDIKALLKAYSAERDASKARADYARAQGDEAAAAAHDRHVAEVDEQIGHVRAEFERQHAARRAEIDAQLSADLQAL